MSQRTKLLDQMLERLRWIAAEYQLDTPYRLRPGLDDAPDVWQARCPLHPDAGLTLLIVDNGDPEPVLRCRVGCPPAYIRDALIPNGERQERAATRAQTLVWAQKLGRERSAA